MKVLLSLFCCLSLSLSLNAQQSKTFEIPLAGLANAATDTEDFFPLLQRLEAPAPDAGSDKAKKAAIREALAEKYPKQNPAFKESSSSILGAQLSRNWYANNIIQGIPNDNDIAIANNGNVASVVNSNIYTYDENGNALGNKSLDAFANSLGIAATKFDPRLLYDPIADRFIITFLAGFSSNISHIIVGFSQNNDPSGNWNLYALPGNPDGDSSWTDYPIISISKNELFISGNLLYDGLSWQEGFKSSLCWQIDLSDGYAGDTLSSILWQGFDFNGKPIRNLCPVKDGSYPLSTGTYLLSNRNFTLGNDTIFLMQITDSINGNPAIVVDYVIADNFYHMPPLVNQKNGTQLSTNDARILDALIENGKIQFVGNTLDTTNGLCAVYHGTILNPAGSNTSCSLNTISSDTLEYGYPSIAWIGTQFGSDECLITINYSSAAHKPGYGAILSDGLSNYSTLSLAKPGVASIDVISGPDRWGDYSGIQRRYNQQGVCWIAATFGKSNKQPGTWISEFIHPSQTVGLIESQQPEIRIAPQPATDIVSVYLELNTAKLLSLDLYNSNGALVKQLLEDRVRAGKSVFSFSAQQLPAGMYFLKITEPSGKLFKTEKIIVQ